MPELPFFIIRRQRGERSPTVAELQRAGFAVSTAVAGADPDDPDEADESAEGKRGPERRNGDACED